ncbi:hypothetical protein LshimejAT787_0802990 [Lyophyllum shimeji]|uniref:Uncharacterized protein n=1 Tax=Lyophyllum shimeji TaxID=47721 RepID=A0A9P3PRU9_LYOSH|nr:hypothetical protein LshimejAT787_0802990 [Lyophyllum shimeji]
MPTGPAKNPTREDLGKFPAFRWLVVREISEQFRATPRPLSAYTQQAVVYLSTSSAAAKPIRKFFGRSRATSGSARRRNEIYLMEVYNARLGKPPKSTSYMMIDALPRV